MKKIYLLIYFTSICIIAQSQPIIGGEETDIQELPWNVSIQIDGVHHCTGSIVNKYWIVTAAHCMPDGTDIEKLTVKAGSTNQTLPIGQVVAVEDYLNHDDWNGDPFNGGDVSLIKLACPLFFNDFSQPIAMDSGGSNSIDIDEFATISGWGCSNPGPCLPMTDILESASIPRISNGEASDSWPGNPSFLTSLLPFFELGKAAGQGDSGGPASFIDDSGNTLLVGISSFGYPPQEEHPTIYTKVSSYYDFITDNTLLTNEMIDCNCENATITGNSNVNDLLDLMRLNSVNEIQTVEGDFIIDGIFTIDQDLTIYEEINLFLTASSEIIIDDGITFTIKGSQLNKCGEELWSGIIINSGGQLILDNSSISGAYQLIDNNGGMISATYSYFSDFFNGINIHNGGSFNKFYSNTIIGTQDDLVYQNINLGNESQYGLKFSGNVGQIGGDVGEGEDPNVFENLITAIIRNNGQNRIVRNEIKNCDRGIISAFSGGSIENNDFINNKYGSIHLFSEGKTQIMNNEFDSSFDNINGSEITCDLTSHLRIENNELNINSNRHAIKIKYNSLTEIAENTINVFKLSAEQFSEIQISGSSNCITNCNQITDIGGSSNGIFTQLTDNSHISCNDINNCEVAIRFEGDSDNTSLATNNLSNNNVGLQLDAGPTIIGIQNNNGNLFQNISKANYYAVPGDVLRSLIRTQNSSNYMPSTIVSPLGWFEFNSETQESCNSGSDCINGIGSNFNSGGTSSLDQFCIDQYLNGNLWPELTNCEKDVRLYQQYRIAKNLTLISSCQQAIIDYLNNQFNAIVIYEAEKMYVDYLNGNNVTQSDLSQAWNIGHTGLQVLDNLIDTYQVLIGQLNTSETTLPTVQINLLKSLAESSFQANGRSVFMAQALLDRSGIEWLEGNSDCIQVIQNRNYEKRKELDLHIYPNPIKKETILQFSDLVTGNIVLFNQLGKQIFTANLEESSALELPSLSEGVYFMKYLGIDGNSKTFKLFILE